MIKTISTMTAKEKEVAEEYSSALADLNVNSKPLINMLTMLADENSAYASIIVQCIERQLHKVQADSKLPVLYLIDSVIKNIGQPYIPLFVQNIEKLFANTFNKVDEKTRANMYKLRTTWNDVITPTKLHAIDVAIHAIDPNWPISAAPPNIHVNPKFLNNVNTNETPKPIQSTLHNDVDEETLRQKFIKKQKELLELQQKKLELELLQTRTQIEIQKKRMNKVNLFKNSSNTSVPPPNDELHAKIQALSENPRKVPEDPLRSTDGAAINSESPTMQTKILVSPSKKFQSTSVATIQQPFKPPPQSFVSQQHHSQMVASNQFFNVTQQIPKINPISTQLLQTLNRDPRLRKVETAVKTTPTLNTAVKNPVLKNKEDKKQLDKPKRDSSKHRDSKRKGRSPSRSPSQKELSRKLHKKPIRKERSPRDEKYHKRREEKKIKEPETKKKSISHIKVQPNVIVTVNHEIPSKDNEKFLKTIPKNDNVIKDHPLIEPMETNFPKEKIVISEIVKEVEVNIPSQISCESELVKTDSPLEDSDSLKRLRKYMQTMKKSPEPATTLLDLKNDSEDICGIKPIQSMLADVIITPQNDIDLRVIAPTVKRTSESIKTDDIEPVAKKSKSEITDELFGAEDVDLRTLTVPPIVPTPPPPPQISETPIPEVSKSWAKYKEVKPDTFKTPYKSPTKKITTELNDKLVENNDTMDVDMRTKPTQNKSHILRQAQEALNAGSISFDEYHQKIMCRVTEMTEAEKSEEANNIEDNKLKLKEYTIPKITQPLNGNETDLQSNLEVTSNLEKLQVNENIPTQDSYNVVNKKSSDVSGSDSDCSSKSGSTGSGESKIINKKSDSEDRPMFNKRHKIFKRNEKENSKSRSWRNKNWNSRQENGQRFSQNKIEPWSRGGPRPNYSHSTRSLVAPPIYEVPRITAPFASSSPDWTVPVISPSDPVILDMIAHDATQTINIDGVSREVRFYGPTAITFVSWDDPREIYFQGSPKNVIFDDLFSVLCHFNTPDREFLLDCQPHRVRLGAPTRELYLDGKFYECFFGGPPIFTDLGGVKRSVKLEGPPPSVNIGTKKRQDLVAGRIAVIIDNTYTVPVYLDAKPQRIDVGNTALILRFIDGLMRAMINDQPFKVNYNGPPQAIIVRGNTHYLSFSGLPTNVRPGYAAISQMMGVVLTEDTTTEPLTPLPAPPLPPNFTAFDIPSLTTIENISQPSPAQSSFSSTYSLAPTTTVPLISNVKPKSEPVTSSYVSPPTPTPTVPTPTVLPPVLPSNMDINELFKKLVDSGIVPQEKPKEVIPLKIKKKEKEADSLIIKSVDFSDPSSLKQKQPGLVHSLYTGIQCSSCGIRFTAEFTIKYSSHLDWHFRQNRREKMASKTVQSRKWYYDSSDWCKYEEQEDETTRAASWFDLQAEQGTKEDEQVEEENIPCIPAGENSELAACYLCHDQFEQFYNEKDEEWQLKNCIEKDKHLYHPMCHDDMIKAREEKLRKRNEAIEEANKRIESEKVEVKDEQLIELKPLEDIKLKDETNEEIELKCEETVPETETITEKKENEEQIIDELESEQISQKLNIEENTKKNDYEDLEIPDTMEIIQVSGEVLSPKLTNEPPIVKETNSSSPSVTQEILHDEIKPRSPSPVSTMTCSIDGNTDTEWNVPVAPAMGTIKINISQKMTPLVKPIVTPIEDKSIEPQSPPDFTPTFGEIDPDQPPPPGLELETVVAPKIQREMKPRLMQNAKKIKEYPILNRGKEMSGLCSIM
ncbi:RNA polymerase II-binding domain,ENTH/VHS,Subunit of cleavage factor IA Pcf11,CID [Cinara cedri]|uniref:RNA polymerase II-binding domain,ENTH/VHS,Subunit of cleavage factor IA Pcf11,CID n=1 Tax=Cinara cedri TaxID=506608 RepID=A0A5E4MR07_9HEMI|nr:RNA polymerase II-binding domain,ENTH/VHS,Subunit of cleavage factor IA Pcf11,CID [Cinara cedri]